MDAVVDIPSFGSPVAAQFVDKRRFGKDVEGSFRRKTILGRLLYHDVAADKSCYVLCKGRVVRAGNPTKLSVLYPSMVDVPTDFPFVQKISDKGCPVWVNKETLDVLQTEPQIVDLEEEIPNEDSFLEDEVASDIEDHLPRRRGRPKRDVQVISAEQRELDRDEETELFGESDEGFEVDEKDSEIEVFDSDHESVVTAREEVADIDQVIACGCSLEDDGKPQQPQPRLTPTRIACTDGVKLKELGSELRTLVTQWGKKDLSFGAGTQRGAGLTKETFEECFKPLLEVIHKI
eukprot:4411866-Amphidinium_carterae.1